MSDEMKNYFELQRLDAITTLMTNGFVGSATSFYVEKGVPYLTSKNIRKSGIDAGNMVFVNSEFHENNKKSILRHGDLLMVQSGHIGTCAVVDEKWEGSNCHALIIIRLDQQRVDPKYAAYYLNSGIGEPTRGICVGGERTVGCEQANWMV